MRTIELTQGQHTVVDDEDYERLAAHKWSAQHSRNTVYAVRRGTSSGSLIMMHREILHLEHTTARIDHRDRDGLNNQKSNLRIATQSQNQQNAVRSKPALSGYRGVQQTRGGRWTARATLNGVTRHLGTYDTPEQAALAFDAYWRASGSEFATLNFP
jgi:hypothetical protein